MKNRYNGFREFREFCKLSKMKLSHIVGLMIDYAVRTKEEIVLDSDHCIASGCKMYECISNLEQEILDEQYKINVDAKKIERLKGDLEFLKQGCMKSKCHCSIKTEFYKNEKLYNTYTKKYANKRLPKTALKLYLLLHLMPIDNVLHIIKNVSSSVLADELGCHVMTVEKSLEILESFGYIEYSHSMDYHHFNIIITDYAEIAQKNKNDKEEKDSKSIVLSKEVIFSLVEIKNVNELRFAILKLLKSDENANKSGDYSCNQMNEWESRNIKYSVASHINYKGKYLKLIEDDKLFDSSYINGKFRFVLNDEYNLKLDKNKFIEEKLGDLSDYLWNAGCADFLPEKVINEISDLLFIYPVVNIVNAIVEIKKYYENRNGYMSPQTFKKVVAQKCYSRIFLTFS